MRCAGRCRQMLLEIERDGTDAIRRYSRELDGWDPPSFIVDRPPIERAERTARRPSCGSTSLSPSSQVRAFAQAQRETLSDLELETLPGVTLGHRHIPVAAVGVLRTWRAISDVRLLLHDRHRPEGRRRRARDRMRAPRHGRRASTRRCSTRWRPREPTRSSHSVAFRRSPLMAFGIEGLPPVDMIVGAGNAYVAEAKRQLFGEVGHRPACRPDRDRDHCR